MFQPSPEPIICLPDTMLSWTTVPVLVISPVPLSPVLAMMLADRFRKFHDMVKSSPEEPIIHTTLIGPTILVYLLPLFNPLIKHGAPVDIDSWYSSTLHRRAEFFCKWTVSLLVCKWHWLLFIFETIISHRYNHLDGDGCALAEIVLSYMSNLYNLSVLRCGGLQYIYVCSCVYLALPYKLALCHAIAWLLNLFE